MAVSFARNPRMPCALVGVRGVRPPYYGGKVFSPPSTKEHPATMAAVCSSCQQRQPTEKNEFWGGHVYDCPWCQGSEPQMFHDRNRVTMVRGNTVNDAPPWLLPRSAREEEESPPPPPPPPCLSREEAALLQTSLALLVIRQRFEASQQHDKAQEEAQEDPNEPPTSTTNVLPTLGHSWMSCIAPTEDKDKKQDDSCSSSSSSLDSCNDPAAAAETKNEEQQHAESMFQMAQTQHEEQTGPLSEGMLLYLCRIMTQKNNDDQEQEKKQEIQKDLSGSSPQSASEEPPRKKPKDARPERDSSHEYYPELVLRTCRQSPETMGALWYTLACTDAQMHSQAQETAGLPVHAPGRLAPKGSLGLWLRQLVQSHLWPNMETMHPSQPHNDKTPVRGQKQSLCRRRRCTHRLPPHEAVYLAPLIRDFHPAEMKTRNPQHPQGWDDDINQEHKNNNNKKRKDGEQNAGNAAEPVYDLNPTTTTTVPPRGRLVSIDEQHQSWCGTFSTTADLLLAGAQQVWLEQYIHALDE